MTEIKKRTRSVNFTLDEKVLLMTIIKDKYKDIVECKKTDSNTWTEKNAAWDEITEEFNAQSLSQTFRSKESLKKCYDNRKKEMRRLAAQNRQEFITGGGTGQQLNDPCLEIIMDITNGKSVNDVDGEATIISDQEENEETYFTYGEVNKKRKEHSDFEDEEAIEELLSENFHDKPSTSEHSQVQAEDSTNYKLTKLKLSNAKLRGKVWYDRRRPKVVEPVRTKYVSKQYSEVASLKKQCLEFELSSAKKKQERDEKEFESRMEEFKLRKKSLELDIQLKEFFLKKLQFSATTDCQ
ncbi:hypothetical protein TcasGA2_TC009068 [Tribolium castaneum]|uniref:Regulatory protein zeste n=1 Tax=Tribolium castaneum TaxID=7070 RepID=D6WPI4_TRICA|nr:PREDICTED: uncharacterized protein LOC103314746 [Tribolium castaneum]EFA06219.1 hypothetical protein TcasGA2_TC009068 [Tribolium castaneum]|eukprot:XP_008199760.1 PREDICTED: uncharacterized protein LOC103314746 [Tribolium castaneum]